MNCVVYQKIYTCYGVKFPIEDYQVDYEEPKIANKFHPYGKNKTITKKGKYNPDHRKE